ncbi:MAG: M20/M25/M40 family metallo-hydrolase [Actinomycetota bacterium]|nr:M20/M25/M40 family metallo-hydrolase [Actinomycetota bacterium]
MTDPQDEAIDICRDLIRFASVNDGTGRGKGEREAAEHVAGLLAEVGLEPQVFESAPGRASVVARMEGTDPGRDALLVHGHLDVVPAEPKEWTYDPFAAEVADGCIWGRGAVDMLDMDAMVLALVRDRMRTGRRPPRDVVLAFLADEEAGGVFGASWLVDHHPQLFDGCTEAISEVGGFSLSVDDDTRLYLIETAQKGMAWLRLTAEGTAGHGSMLSSDNAVTELCDAVARLGRHRFPTHLTPTVRRFLAEVSDAYGVELDPDDLDQIRSVLGPMSRILGATLRNTANPTMLDAGYKHNVIPGRAHANVDGRFLPGFEDDWERELDEVLGPRIVREHLHRDIALETEFEGALVAAMGASLKAEDPGARPVPYMLSGGTDAKSFSRLGIRGFGFAPLRLPADLDFSGMFHGVDERVPLDALKFGVRVLDRFLDAC